MEYSIGFTFLIVIVGSIQWSTGLLAPEMYGSSPYISNSIANTKSSYERQGVAIPPGLNVMFGPGAPSSGQYGSPQAQGPPYPPYSYKDPGFSVQTGFEGFLVPNPWYGPISWGIEGIVLVSIAVIFFLTIKAGIIFLLLKIFGFGKIFRDDDGSEATSSSDGRSLISGIWKENILNTITTEVLDGIDRYKELIKLRKQ